jgi:hypothetical protein
MALAKLQENKHDREEERKGISYFSSRTYDKRSKSYLPTSQILIPRPE